MMRSLLIRGMLVGLAAAALAYVVAWFLGEPQVALAISFEEAKAAAAGEAHDHEVFSRTVQETLGLITALVVYGVAFGGLFSIVFAFAHGRIGDFRPRTTAALVALVGFAVIYVVPFLKYPPNPPAVGSEDTIGSRTTLYVTMILLSLLTTAVALYAGRRLAPRLGGWNATLAAVGVFAVIIGITYVVMPEVNEVPGDFSATVLWRFRLASLAIQLTVWGTLGLLFGGLTDRALGRRTAGVPTAVGV
ncbi:CbtA family protein [Planotetraspora phitsanulokensis]|uniref:Membrane protein n=1 Tax=Planotetraspora phitsanulokensis TaxID=575192 RepID=A0A8J3UJD6_9ACTN|nr:CbtA family protein [Planotetraspora phitsanulokensis]GII39870.1 membrane protein [Planotetraspora phitsanulokensis]